MATMTWLGCCQVSGRCWAAYIGLSVYPAWVLADVGSNPAVSSAHRHVIVLACLVPAACAASLIHRGRQAPEVDTGFHPWRLFAVLSGIVAATVVAGTVVWGFGPAPALSETIVIGSGVAGTLLWSLAAAECLRTPGVGIRSRVVIAGSLLAFGVSALERVISAESSDEAVASWAIAAARVASLLGFAVLLATGVRSLRRARYLLRERQRALRRMRDRVARTLEDQARADRERRHDLRSLAAGIAGATATLTDYRAFLSADDVRDLEGALSAEVTRLRRSLADVGGRVRFNLRAAIRPTVLAERTRGTPISGDLLDIDVVGSSDATAAIVQNLVANARCHAAGAAIRISARVVDGVVRIAVEDDGPGLPDDVRRWADALFRDHGTTARVPIPAQRLDAEQPRATKPGHMGLGLAICARLAREQGAHLRLVETSGGTCIELLLRAATSLASIGVAS
jgi:signal transduction histidine kinase